MNDRDDKKGRHERGKSLGAALNVLCVLIVALVLYVVISYNTSNEIFGAAYYVENANDMSPLINKNDVVKTDKSFAIENVEVGDRIAFYMDVDADGARETVFRNVAEKEFIDGKYSLLTVAEGDAQTDSWYVTEKSYIGNIVSVSSKGGAFLTFLKNDNFMIAVIVAIVLFLAYEIGMYVISKQAYYRKLDKEEADAEAAVAADAAKKAADKLAVDATALQNGQNIGKQRKVAYYDATEKQYIGEINKQVIGLYPKKRDNVRMFYGTLPYKSKRNNN